MAKAGTVDIHGNEYKTVALRVFELREAHPDWSLVTKLISDEFYVVFKATLCDTDGNVISTGHAEEARDKDDTNRDSAMEVCETSAVGRCLAFASWPGSEIEFDPNIASADEVANAIQKQHEREQGTYMALVNEHWDSVVGIKQLLLDGHFDAALEAWRELGHEVMQGMWKAPTKGGIFTVNERHQITEAAENAAIALRDATSPTTGED